MAPRIESLTVKNLRSVGDERVSIRFPERGALVLLGENNAGKSNITRALDIVFGDMWPGNRQMEDHDFHGRDGDGIAIEVGAQVSGIACPYCERGDVQYFNWRYDLQHTSDNGNPVVYRFGCSNQYCGKTFVKNEMRSALAASVLNADRRLDYQLSYASKYTMLSKLMHRFHNRLLADPQRKERLAGVFRSLLDEFGGIAEFADFKRLLAETATDFGQNLPYRLDVDFSAYDPSNFFRSIRIHPSLSGEIRSFDELGTGQSQVLALAFAYAYAKAYGQAEGMILVIDEPEANLHPLAQQWLASRLNELAVPGLQVIITTHSPHFVDLARPENLVLVSKPEDRATRAVQLQPEKLRTFLVDRGADPDRTRVDSIGPFYAAGATTEIVSGLFARRCVLVEGRTEALALPELLRARGLDVLKEGIAVVPVEGIGNIAKWLRLYTALGVNCFCMFDTDSDKAGKEAANLLVKRQGIVAALGLDASVASAGNLSAEPIAVELGYATLNPNFEGAVAAIFGSAWARHYAEAESLVGESKPLRARYAAERVAAQLPKDAEAILDRLVRAVSGRPPGDTVSGSAGVSSARPDPAVQPHPFENWPSSSSEGRDDEPAF